METRLKERLVGAIVLVAIVVIVVPELLTGPRRGAGTAHDASSSPATPVRVVTIDMASGNHTTEPPAERAPATLLPVPPPTNAGGTAGAPATVPSSAGATTGATSGSAPAAAAPVSSNAAPASSPKPPVPSSTTPRASDTAPAAAQPSAATPHSDELPKTAVAPNAAAAPKAANAAKTADAPKAVDAPKSAEPARAASVAKSADAAKPAPATKSPEASKSAETPKPATRSAAPGSGWVVQLGSFASRPNAEKLVAELRQAGYTAFVSEFRGSGKVLYRVRVGPEQDRARADALAQRLARDGRTGTVAPHP